MSEIEQFLLRDPQCQPPAGQCEVCGSLVYAPGFWCIRCERGRS